MAKKLFQRITETQPQQIPFNFVHNKTIKSSKCEKSLGIKLIIKYASTQTSKKCAKSPAENYMH